MPSDREKLLLSPADYFRLADAHLRSCRFRQTEFDGPQIVSDGRVYHFGGAIILQNDYELTFDETCFCESKFELVRDIRYDFRLTGATVETFRFDNHGRLLALNGACHLHLGGQSELEDGDSRLRGYSLVDMHLVEVVKLVCKFFRREDLPWQ
ncbi:MAG: hypothetical protein ABSD13_15700 [Candidatus Korobacteraceae bacterium]